jgi:hypothetical protein
MPVRLPAVLALLLLVAPAIWQRARAQGPSETDSLHRVGSGMGAAPASPPTRWNISGDFRHREEYSFRLLDAPDRHRQRVRARLGAGFRISDQVQFGGRITTGARTDANSPYQTLGSGFHKLELSIDRAFAVFRPRFAPDFSVTAGKFAHPFVTNPIYPEVVWDADVQPEGLLVGYSSTSAGVVQRVDLHGGRYALVENAAGRDAWVLAVQAAVQLRLAPRARSAVSVAWYGYNEMVPGQATLLVGENAGNAITGTGPAARYVSDFRILHPSVSFSLDSGPGVTAAAEYIRNTGARIERDEGWSAGLAIGSTARRGGWRAYYQRVVVEQDAVVSFVAQDDFLFQTNHRSHVFGLAVVPLAGTQLHLWALLSRMDSPPATRPEETRHQARVRLDLTFAF